MARLSVLLELEVDYEPLLETASKLDLSDEDDLAALLCGSIEMEYEHIAATAMIHSVEIK